MFFKQNNLNKLKLFASCTLISLAMTGCSNVFKSEKSVVTGNIDLIQKSKVSCKKEKYENDHKKCSKCDTNDVHKNDKKKKKKGCELSALFSVDDYIVSMNDKKSNKLYAYDKKDLRSSSLVKETVHTSAYIKLPKQFKIKKIEAATQFKNWFILSSAFDRTTKPEYTRMLAIHKNEIKKNKNNKKIKIKKADILGDLVVFEKIKKALNGQGKKIDYFKIEGIAVIENPDLRVSLKEKNILVLGIREEGKSYKVGENSNSTRMVGVGIYEENGKLKLHDDWRLLYSHSYYDPQYGISDLQYDEEEKKLYVLLSSETNKVESDGRKELNGALARISIPDLMAQREFEILDNQIFQKHKPEGLVKLDHKEWMIVADDDRENIGFSDSEYERKNSEAFYWHIRLRK
ncbi:MAG: hypothetical protein C0432_03605 [Candidatus Puniceispirillum sp.]|nr:hypothetical protein [Candidatus Pelagibacter sp.]MBA4283360.1 hypothetical protein [Candidatus Puniceispirillum sp.]